MIKMRLTGFEINELLKMGVVEVERSHGYYILELVNDELIITTMDRLDDEYIKKQLEVK